MDATRKMTAAEARAALAVYPPEVPDMHNSDGVPFDKNGGRIDERRLVENVYALGPFGSWLCTVADAEGDFSTHETWWLCESIRLGWVVVYAQGWGYAANHPDHANACPKRVSPSGPCSCGGAA